MSSTDVLHNLVPAVERSPTDSTQMPVVGDVFRLNVSPKATFLSEATAEVTTCPTTLKGTGGGNTGHCQLTNLVGNVAMTLDANLLLMHLWRCRND